jgi:hypothetical protein
MSRRFYLTLPSNSSGDYYPNNTTAQFTTKLNGRYELNGSWEVGLVELIIPSDIQNVYGDAFYFTIRRHVGGDVRVKIPDGNYTRRSLVYAMKQELRIVQISQRIPANMIQFALKPDSIAMRLRAFRGFAGIEFSRDLAYMIQFKPVHLYTPSGDYRSEAEPVMSGRTTPIMVYCNLLQHVAVGDTAAPLLRMAEMPTRNTGIYRQSFSPILYIPLHQKSFDSITIHIMDDMGRPVSFSSGTCNIVLEFRKRI